MSKSTKSGEIAYNFLTRDGGPGEEFASWKCEKTCILEMDDPAGVADEIYSWTLKFQHGRTPPAYFVVEVAFAEDWGPVASVCLVARNILTDEREYGAVVA